MKMKAKLFAEAMAALGEGPIWHPKHNCLFWLDIIGQTLFQKAWPGSGPVADRQWDLPETASALAVDGNNSNRLWMVTDQSFGVFSLENGCYEPHLELRLPEIQRANDGGVGPDGCFWFGTMERNPTGPHGNVYAVSRDGFLHHHLAKIGIPNTFCWSKDGDSFYLSDSSRQRMLVYDVNHYEIQPSSQRTLVDLSAGRATPDGGAMDERGILWVCQWDGGRVVGYDHSGLDTGRISVPVPRPTSCCFGGPEMRHLFITSAREGLSESDLAISPESGSVFVVELPIPGQVVPAFTMDGAKC